jgi:hypothetical protein
LVNAAPSQVAGDALHYLHGCPHAVELYASGAVRRIADGGWMGR